MPDSESVPSLRISTPACDAGGIIAAGYSIDLRERVVAAIQEGTSRRKAARLFNVSPSVAVRWKQREVETGSCAAMPTGGDRRSHALEAHQAWLLLLIAEESDLTLEEIRGRLAAEFAFKASVSMLWQFFRRHKISFKRNAARRRVGPAGRGYSTSRMA